MHILFLNVLAVFLLMVPGFWLRRRHVLSDAGTAEMARLVPYAVYPCLIFTVIVKSYTLRELAAEWVLPAAAAGLMLLGAAAGWLLAPGFRFASGDQRRSFLFQCAFNNYSFLPLPLVGMLWGEKATGRLILASLGAELVLWTLGVWILAHSRSAATESGREPPRAKGHPLARLLTPVLVAMALAVGVLALRDVAGFAWLSPAAAGTGGVLWGWAMKVGTMIGAATIPLAMTVAGAGIARMRLEELKNPLVWRAGAIRLLFVPLLALPALQWLPLHAEARQVLQVVAVMPCAVASIMFCKVYGGDDHFTAGTVLLTHILALATVPLLLALVL